MISFNTNEKIILFTGRPNSGKTSLIKSLTKKKTLRVGKRPGTTSSFFRIIITPQLSIIDSPGYGKIFGASKSKQERIKDQFIDFIENEGHRILLAFHIVDLLSFSEVSERLDAKGYIPIDVEIVMFLQETQGKIFVIGNKIDRFSSKRELNNVKKDLKERMPLKVESYFISAKKGIGVTTIKKKINQPHNP